MFAKIYSAPLICKVVKKTIMGNLHDKTFDFYMEKSIESHFEEEYIIEYLSDDKHYSLCCNNGNYKDAMEYIKTHKKYNTKEKYKKIIYAFEDLGDDTNDITQELVSYYGPNKDFYKDTEFKLLGGYISEFPIIVVTNDMKIYRFRDKDLLDIENDFFSCDINSMIGDIV
jgi:hypothetical protein